MDTTVPIAELAVARREKAAASREMPSCNAPAAKHAVFVLGMHRSGTSAVTRVLNLLGVDLSRQLMAPSPFNERGYWEHMEIVQVHDQLLASLGSHWDDIRPLPEEWSKTPAALKFAQGLRAIVERDFAASSLWGLKDPRLCRLVPLWLPLLRAMNVAPHFVLVLRDPREVAASIGKRDGKIQAASALLWLRHTLEAERATRGFPRVIVHYNDLMEKPGAWPDEFRRIGGLLGLNWPHEPETVEKEVAAFLSPALRHNRAADRGVASADANNDDGLGEWVNTVYDAMRVRQCQTGVCDAVSAELARADQIWRHLAPGMSRYSGAVPVAGAAVGQQPALDQTARLEHLVAELRNEVTRKDTELREAQVAVQKFGRGLMSPLPVVQAYAKWMEGITQSALGRADWVVERVAQWPHVPRFLLGMAVPPGIEDHVAATIASLKAQTAGDWRLEIVAENAVPAGMETDPRVAWHQVARERPMAALSSMLNGAKADWVGLVDAGDRLAPHALFALGDAGFRHSEWGAVYSDEDRIDVQGKRSSPQFKPDFNLDLMRSMPYVGGLLIVRPEIFDAVGGFDPERDGLEEYDLALRLAERLGASKFGHVADVLYHRIAGGGRTRRPLQEILLEGPRTVAAHLQRLGIDGTVELGAMPTQYRVRYRHAGPDPLVSIIVPTKDRLPLLKRCVETVLGKTAYANYEIIVIDNGSSARDACEYLNLIESRSNDIGGRLRVIRHPGAFNFSAMNNRAVREQSRGEYLCFLNNDTAAIDADWLGELMMHARRPDVGVVGAKLMFPNNTIQHGGVVLGVGWGAPAEHPYIGEPANANGYWGRLKAVQDFSAVTAACMVTRRSLFDELGGFDAEELPDNYNDVDYCLKARKAGYLVVWTPHAQLMHESGVSRRAEAQKTSADIQNQRRNRERETMYRRWMPMIAFDPAYNRNLSSLGKGFDIESERIRCWDPDFRPRSRVVAHPADRDACGEYRVIAPSRALFGAGILHVFETMRLMMPPEYGRIEPDTIIFQRQIELHQIEKIEEIKRLSKAFRVFELDDLLTNLPLKSAHRADIPRDIGQRLRRALAACNRLIVSTEPLARAYGGMCDEVIVLPNRLERARWQGLRPQRCLEGRPRVGWAGAAGHLGDLQFLASIVQETSKEMDWVFFGMCPDTLRPFVKEFHEWVPIWDYPAKLAALGLDLGVAPLEENAFNEAKSNLRLLDYGVLGIPVVCTDILPYQCGLPVRRVKNRHREWIKAIREMVADREACQSEGNVLREAVLADWMLDRHLDDWRKAWLR